MGKYGSIVIYDPEGVPKGFAEDMPIFVLLGQDELAGPPIDAYADTLAAKAREFEDEGDPDAAARFYGYAEDVRGFAANLRAWQAANLDKVKLPD